jgi:hypothetical protein
VLDATERYQPVDRSPDASLRRRFQRVSRVCLTAATLVAFGVAIGEVFDVRWLRAGPSAWAVRPVPVPSLASALLVVSGLWLALFSGGRHVAIGRVLLLFVSFSGVAWLGFTFWGVAVDPTGLQVPASSAAFGFSAVALAGLLVSLPRGAGAGQMVALGAGTVVTVPLLGYVLGARVLAGFPFGFGVISVPTIAVLMLLSAAIAFARPDSGLIDVATSKSLGGVLLRWLLVPVLALPPVLIIAISAGEARPLRTLAWVGSALSATAVVALVATARVIDRLDDSRRRAADERAALASGLVQDAELVPYVAESLGVIGSIPRSLAVGVRRAAAEGVVGGDAYALIGLRGKRLACVLVDIASKGAKPAATAVRLRDSIVSALAAGVGPARALHSASWLVNSSTLMATAFVGLVDTETRQMLYASAGHVPGLRRAGGDVHLLEHTGPLLHRDVDPGWTERTCAIERGDSILIYSDGIADVVVKPDGATSIGSFVELVAVCPHRDPDRVASWCLERLEASPDWVLDDDATLIVVGQRRLRGQARTGGAGGAD